VTPNPSSVVSKGEGFTIIGFAKIENGELSISSESDFATEIVKKTDLEDYLNGNDALILQVSTRRESRAAIPVSTLTPT